MKSQSAIAMVSAVLCAFVAALASCAAQSATQTSAPASAEVIRVPMGRLGEPIGTFLRVEGVRSEHGKTGSSTLLVDRVNGSGVSPPVSIWLDNLSLPRGERCIVSGYESARWIGLPPEVRRAENLPERQAVWQQQIYFIVTSVQSPETLRSQNARNGGS